MMTNMVFGAMAGLHLVGLIVWLVVATLIRNREEQ